MSQIPYVILAIMVALEERDWEKGTHAPKTGTGPKAASTTTPAPTTAVATH